jgi:hypothetical protein
MISVNRLKEFFSKVFTTHQFPSFLIEFSLVIQVLYDKQHNIYQCFDQAHEFQFLICFVIFQDLIFYDNLATTLSKLIYLLFLIVVDLIDDS